MPETDPLTEALAAMDAAAVDALARSRLSPVLAQEASAYFAVFVRYLAVNAAMYGDTTAHEYMQQQSIGMQTFIEAVRRGAEASGGADY